MKPTSTNPTPRKMPSKRIMVVGVLAFAGFAVVMAAIEYLTYRGQVEFGRHYLDLSGWTLAAAYCALQGGMLASAALGLWSVLAKDGYFWHRVWTGITLGAACLADYLGAQAAGWPTTGALYVAGFSILALRTWHAILKRISRDMTPKWSFLRYPVLRWILAPGETRRAFRVSYLDNLSPDDALALVRGADVPRPSTSTAGGNGDGAPDLTTMTKREAVEHAASATGSFEPSTVRAYLAEHGVTVDKSYAASTLRDLVAKRRREIHAVNPGDGRKAG